MSKIETHCFFQKFWARSSFRLHNLRRAPSVGHREWRLQLAALNWLDKWFWECVLWSVVPIWRGQKLIGGVSFCTSPEDRTCCSQSIGGKLAYVCFHPWAWTTFWQWEEERSTSLHGVFGKSSQGGSCCSQSKGWGHPCFALFLRLEQCRSPALLLGK